MWTDFCRVSHIDLTYNASALTFCIIKIKMLISKLSMEKGII